MSAPATAKKKAAPRSRKPKTTTSFLVDSHQFRTSIRRLKPLAAKPTERPGLSVLSFECHAGKVTIAACDGMVLGVDVLDVDSDGLVVEDFSIQVSLRELPLLVAAANSWLVNAIPVSVSGGSLTVGDPLDGGVTVGDSTSHPFPWWRRLFEDSIIVPDRPIDTIHVNPEYLRKFAQVSKNMRMKIVGAAPHKIFAEDGDRFIGICMPMRAAAGTPNWSRFGIDVDGGAA